MSDFISVFFAVFLAVTLGEIAKEAYQRYVKDHINKGFDKIDETTHKVVNRE